MKPCHVLLLLANIKIERVLCAAVASFRPGSDKIDVPYDDVHILSRSLLSCI
jgi:hypothetical protein